MKSRFLLQAGAIVVASLSAAAASATVVVDRPIPELAQHADLVVRGTVLDTRTAWNDRHDVIQTRTTIRPTEVLKGEAARDVVILQVGGSLDGLHMPVQGSASFLKGEDVVVFLEKVTDTKGAEMVLETMAASKYRIVRRPTGLMAERSTTGISFARPGPDGVFRVTENGAPTPGVLPYDELVRRVRSAPAPTKSSPTPAPDRLHPISR